MPMDFVDWCPFDGWHPGFTWGYRHRETSGELFAQVEAGARAALAEPDLGMTPALLHQLTLATGGANLTGTLGDEPDLGGLQFGWAMVRWLLGAGATVVLDAVSGQWFTRDQVLAFQPEGWLGHRFALEREVGFSTLPVHGEPRWVVRTHGLTKFGRADLALVFDTDERDVHAEVRTTRLPLWPREACVDLASRLTLGERLEPGQSVTFGSQRLTCARSPHEQGLLELRA
jgi:hypothetical protein